MSITPFTHEGSPVRVVIIDDAPHFVAGDVCDYFGVTNRNRVMQHIDSDEKGGTQIDTPGGRQTVTVLTESGLYHLLFILQPAKARGMDTSHIDARLQQLANFRRWITAEVLPSIRRHGGYLTPEATEAALTDPDFIIRLATSLKDERARRVELEAQAEVDAPKVAYVDTYVADSDLLTIRTLAANLNVGESWLRGLLIQKRWIYSETATRWSNQKQAKETVYRYSAYSHKRAYFAPRPVHDAPRFKGEVMHTLKVTPAGAVAIAKLVRLAQAPLSVVGAEEVVPA